jgi:manganese efflux pump family protein
MEWWSLLAVAVALAMDAFAVAVVAGSTVHPLTWRHVFRLSFHFGLFQALMPLLGWAGGVAVHRFLAPVDHWIAFALLAGVGGSMVIGARREEERASVDPTSGWTLVGLSVATSIDALAVGLSLALVGSPILLPAAVIGIVALLFTATGMLLGRRIGRRWGKRVVILGGVVLIAIGANIVREHLAA